MNKQLQNEPDIFALMTKIQQQLAVLDKKVDALMNKAVPRSVEARPLPQPSLQQPVHAHDPVPGAARPQDRPRGRQMHQATCAECQKECEIPFKPSGDRPVYCKECFLRRKTGNTLKGTADNKPKETPVVSVVMDTAIPVKADLPKEKKKPVAAKKSAGKKKVVSKKKK